MLEKIKNWLVKNWFNLVNFIVLFTSYSIIFGVEKALYAEVLLGLWIMVNVGYFGYKWFTKKKI